MSGLDGLNGIFGSLTTKSGNALTFKRLDTDRNGEITEKELQRAIKLYGCDSVSFSSLDANHDGAISEEEFAIIEQNKALQGVINEFKGTLGDLFKGIDESYIPTAVNSIKEFALSYVAEHSGDSNITENFRNDLKSFISELKSSDAYSDMPSKVLSRVLDDVFANNIADSSMSKQVRQNLFEKMFEVGEAYVLKNQKSPNLEQDLKNYLIYFMNSSESSRMEDAANSFANKVASYGENIDRYEFNDLKNDAKELLREAFEQGLTQVKLGSKNVTKGSIDAVVNNNYSYSNREQLINDINALISSLSTLSEKAKIIDSTLEAQRRAEEEAEQET